MPSPLSSHSVLGAIHTALSPLREAFVDTEDTRVAAAIAELLALRDAIVLEEAVAIATGDTSTGPA